MAYLDINGRSEGYTCKSFGEVYILYEVQASRPYLTWVSEKGYRRLVAERQKANLERMFLAEEKRGGAEGSSAR